MHRLVSFGCSYTYGHGLKDCHIEPDKFGPYPSQLAWPSLLSEKMCCTLVNTSSPGSSNIHILWKVLNFDFHNEDMCVVMWTHFGRIPFSRLYNDPTKIVWDHYDNASSLQIAETEQENLVIRNFMLMHHAYLHLSQKGIKHLFVIATKDSKIYQCPNALQTKSLFTDLTFPKIDVALDKRHPGPKSHAAMASLLYNKINELY
jgi:hypothetical protein